MTDEQRAMSAATRAALRVLTASKNKRTVLGRMTPTMVAYHVALAAIDAYKRELDRG